MSRILPIPADAVLQIHSSKQITSLQGVILSLLENSLDAGASKVDIILDFRRGGCTLEDNGYGIPSAEFGLDGGLGRMYHTSKRHDENVGLHGSTGMYLANLGALSLLTITSRHRDHQHYATLVVHRGTVLVRHVPAPQSQELSTAHGTRVTVNDLFGNMPVRVKQRAFATEGGIEDERAWLEVKRGIAALLLAWPGPCAVKMRDVHCEARSVNFAGGYAAGNAALTEKTLNQLAGKTVKYDFRDALPVVFQAGLAPQASRHRWIPVSASAGGMTVKGAICLDPAPTKQCQFVSIGIHPCALGSGQHALYDAVNRVFANSSFGTIDDAPQIDEAEKLRRKNDRRYNNDGYTQKQLQGRKGVDRWPMFVLQVRNRDGGVQYLGADGTSDATLKGMVDLLEVTATEWLAAHHFRPQKRKRKRNEDQQGPASASSTPSKIASPARNDRSRAADSPMLTTPSLKRPATASSATTSKRLRVGEGSVRHSPSTYFNGLSRIKSGKNGFYEDLWEARKPATAPAGQSGTVVAAVKAVKHPFKLEPVQAGELSVKGTSSRPKAQPGSITAASEAGQGAVSSDDFGSVDSDALLEVTARVERNVPATTAASASTAGDARLINDGASTNDEIVSWTDPVTKQTYQVNSRTGVVLPAKPRLQHTISGAAPTTNSPPRRRAAIDTSLSSAGLFMSLARRKDRPSTRTGNQTLPGFLKDWDNPVFQKQDEQSISVTSFAGPGMDVAEACNHRCNDHMLTQHFGEIGDKGTSKMSKAALRRVRVIRQVDEKFILCSMPSKDTGSTLLLVDQHAASERIILEGLLSELCAPVDRSSVTGAYTSKLGCQAAVATILLQQPQRFVVSEKESELFTKHAQHFADWGILYDLAPTRTAATASQVREASPEQILLVRALPPGIAERCTLLPNLLIELLRAEVWTLAQASMQPRSRRGAANEHERDWPQRIGSCPRGILDMLNSRACRSAIMFNDVLSMSQCEELLADLSRCSFPFMCAHGRVSMIPLVSLSSAGGDAGGLGLFAKRAGEHHGFADAFRSWRRSWTDG